MKIASKSDLNTISSLARQIWPVSYKETLSKAQIENMLEKIYSIENLTYENEKLGHVFWIASDESKAVGFISAYVEAHNLWIKKLYILPEEQSKGYGSCLVNVALSSYKDVQSISLLVNSNNNNAQQFYLGKGFKEVGRKSVKMGDYDFIDIVMSKEVN